MKKLILSVAAIAVFAFTSCSSDDDNAKSCEQLMQEYTAAFDAYFDEDNEANCNAYKAALQAYVDKNCQGSSQLEAQLEGLDCSED